MALGSRFIQRCQFIVRQYVFGPAILTGHFHLRVLQEGFLIFLAQGQQGIFKALARARAAPVQILPVEFLEMHTAEDDVDEAFTIGMVLQIRRQSTDLGDIGFDTGQVFILRARQGLDEETAGCSNGVSWLTRTPRLIVDGTCSDVNR